MCSKIYEDPPYQIVFLGKLVCHLRTVEQTDRQTTTVKIASAFLQNFCEETRKIFLSEYKRRKDYKDFCTLYSLNCVLLTGSRVWARAEKKSTFDILKRVDL